MTAARQYIIGNATYPGDVRECVGSVYGPTTLGQMVVATAAEYTRTVDEVVGSTRVEFSSLPIVDEASA